MRAGTHRDRAPEETQHGGRKPPKKGQERGPRHRGKGHHGRRHNPHPGRAYHDGETSAAPTPPTAARRPGAHPPTRTAEASIGRRTDHTSAQPPATGSHTGDGGHTYTGRTGYTHLGSSREHRRAAHHRALTARRRPRLPQGPPHRHRKRTKARPQQPGLGQHQEPQRTRDQGTGPQGGQPHGRLPDPPGRAARQGPHSADPASHPHLTAAPSHQPATLQPAPRTTTQARLTSTDPPRHNARQHGTPHHSAPQCNAPQHNATRRSTERHNTARVTLT